MRSMCRILVASAVAALAFPQLAMADQNIEEQLRLMNERMSQLEDQLQATKDELDDSRGTIERQQELIEKADIGEGEGKSGLDDFFTKIEIGGWVATSWFYNFNNPRDTNSFANAGTFAGIGAGVGTAPAFYPYHPDHNTFQLDQFWIEMEKPVTEESRAGFRVDMVYGKTAGLLNGALLDYITNDSASEFNLFQAYVQYLIPWGGITLKAGKFATIVGAEVPQTVYNFNITRGNLFNLLQPVTHYGILLEGDVGSFNWKIGAVNDGNCNEVIGNCSGTDPDFNDAKSLIASAGYSGETFSVATSIIWGVDDDGIDPDGIQQTGDSGFGETGLVDLLLTWDPTERISTWLNFNYKWVPDSLSRNFGFNDGGDAWGIAMAARLGLTETIGFAVRGEFLMDSNAVIGFAEGDSEVSGITGTLDWTITDGLVAKAEIRWDSVTISDGRDESVFINNNKGATRFTRSDQLVGGVELTYQF